MAREEQKLRSEQVRRSILDTALEIGMQEGFEAVSIRKITQKMKYSTGVVYCHFKDKQEILDAIEESETQKLYSAISSLLDDAKDAVYNMKTVFHGIMRLAFESPHLYSLIVLQKFGRSRTEQPIWIAYLSDNLKKDLETGLIRKLDADMTAFSVWSSFLGFNLMIAQKPGLTGEEAERLFQTEFGLITEGILAPDRRHIP